MFNKLYHVSTIPNLTKLEPRVSTHGRAYVYATPNLELALLFGSKKSNGDFDGICGVNEQGKPFFYEAYDGALKRCFEDETCYIYEVETETFKSGQTGFMGEVVSEESVKVLNCTEVQDVYKYLLELIENGKIEFKAYSMDKKYQKMIREHIKSRLIEYGILNRKDTPIYRFCRQKFPEIVDSLESSLVQ